MLAAQRSDDGGSGIVPAALARRLGAAYLSNVAAIRLSGKRVEVERKLERGNRQVWSAALPAVVAVESGSVLVRHVSVAGLILARRRAVETVTPASFGVDASSLMQLNQPKRLATPPSEEDGCPRRSARPDGQGPEHDDGSPLWQCRQFGHEFKRQENPYRSG